MKGRKAGWARQMRGHGVVAERAGASLLDLEGGFAGEAVDRVRAGWPYKSLREVAEAYHLDLRAVAGILRIPERTLARRRHSGRFLADESDRLARLARVGALAQSILGDREKTSRWLTTGNPALGGRPPLDLLDTDPGCRQVEGVLQRISHGIVS